MTQNVPFGRLLFAALALLLSGCSSPGVKLPTVRIRWAHDPESLDPLQLPNQVALEALNLLHLSLLQIDFSRQQHGPALASSLPVVELLGDSLTRLHYDMRTAAAWDDGRPVLASDVAFSLKLMFCPGLPNEAARARYSFIREVEIDKTNPRRFTIVCRGRSLEYAQESGDFPVLPEATLDPQGRLRRFTLAALQSRPATAPPDSALQAVANQYLALDPGRFPSRLPGCGPYQLVRWEKDRYLTFRRKAHWWADRLRPVSTSLQARPPKLDYVIIPNAATALLALQRGDVDVYPQMPARDFERLRTTPATRASLNFYSTPSYDVVLAGFNTRHPALADALTRQALSHCFDAAGLLRATQMGVGQRTVGIISPTNRPNYNEHLSLIPFDPSGGARLLHQAGWQHQPAPEIGWFRRDQHGQRQQLRLMVRYRTDESLFATVALQFQAAAAGLDIPVTLQPTESGAFTVALRAGDFDMYVRILKGNPFMFNFTPIFHTLGVGAGNTTGFSNPASDRLIEAIAAADTEAQRAELLQHFQALMQEQAPIVPLFFLPNRVVASRRLAGLHTSSLKPGYDVLAITPAPSPVLNP